MGGDRLDYLPVREREGAVRVSLLYNLLDCQNLSETKFVKGAGNLPLT